MSGAATNDKGLTKHFVINIFGLQLSDLNDFQKVELVFLIAESDVVFQDQDLDLRKQFEFGEYWV